MGHKKIEEGQACSPGCLNHVSHPCEKCKRVAGRGAAYLQAPLTIRDSDVDAVVMWCDELADRDKLRILNVMESEGFDCKLEDYDCAEDVLRDLVWNMCI